MSSPFAPLLLAVLAVLLASAAEPVRSPFADDPAQTRERTCFQTGGAWSESGNLRSDVAIVYGIDPGLPARIQTWRDHGYRIHVMTGVSWGNYQDYLYGRFDGTNHVDEAQTDRNGKTISHGGDVYYMSPGVNYGRFLCVGVQRALDAGAEAIHLEEPEFWVRGGYSEGFKREWRKHYGEEWQPPHASVDAQWRASKLKYFLYRRALQQVFDYVQEYNRHSGRHVRCYVPTHSLLNYAQWHIVSPESSLARLNGCDGYIAQVWTGTSRTPNFYHGQRRERTFETAFLEYGAMQNLVRSTGRTVWYLNDPVEDDPRHDWGDYQRNWESTLTASLLQPDVWQFEVAPWPERVFGGRYPRPGHPAELEPMPSAYATEVQTVINALNDLRQNRVAWDCGTTGLGVLVSDSLMFQRGEPLASDPNLGQVYGLALPFLKRGMPITPVQLENVGIAHYLDGFHTLLLTYHGMKPLSPDVHAPLAAWVQHGGHLLVCDDDQDPYLAVREWWNSAGRDLHSPREDLFQRLGVSAPKGFPQSVGKGRVSWLKLNPAELAQRADGDVPLVKAAEAFLPVGTVWRETDHLLLRRGPYVVAAGLEESVGAKPTVLPGRFVNLFDPELRVQTRLTLAPASRLFLVDLDRVATRPGTVIAAAARLLETRRQGAGVAWAIEAVAGTEGKVLLATRRAPRQVTLGGQPLAAWGYDAANHLLRLTLTNTATPRELAVRW